MRQRNTSNDNLILQLYADGLSLNEISRRTGISLGWVSTLLRRLGRNPNGFRSIHGDIVVKGCSRWTPAKEALLRQRFATTKNEDLCDLLGMSLRTVLRRARLLGLEKDPVWLASVWNGNRKLAQFESRRMGYPGCFQPGNMVGAEYRFRPGHKPMRKGEKLKDICNEQQQ